MTFPAPLQAAATSVLNAARAKNIRIATAESCTGGLIAGLLTEIPGSSDVVDRGFVVYSNPAKEDMLGVPHQTLLEHGAVSRETAVAMVEGALSHSLAQAAVAVTGIAGPGGGTAQKPIGLVYVAAGTRSAITVEECRFGSLSRQDIRLRTIETAIRLLSHAIITG